MAHAVSAGLLPLSFVNATLAPLTEASLAKEGLGGHLGAAYMAVKLLMVLRELEGDEALAKR